jgi:hypothetical protein
MVFFDLPFCPRTGFTADSQDTPRRKAGIVDWIVAAHLQPTTLSPSHSIFYSIMLSLKIHMPSHSHSHSLFIIMHAFLDSTSMLSLSLSHSNKSHQEHLSVERNFLSFIR